MVAKQRSSKVQSAQVSPRIAGRTRLLSVSAVLAASIVGCSRRVGSEEAIAMLPACVGDVLPSEVRVVGFLESQRLDASDGPNSYRRWLLWTPDRFALAEDFAVMETHRIPAESVRAAVSAELQDESVVEAKEPFAEVTSWQDAGLTYWLAQMETSDGWYSRLEEMTIAKTTGDAGQLKRD
jgi:hypothetical protein